ncbi:MAG TPA: hypothetical protein PKD49_10070 [Hyphomicrobium sp.]|nr:hypothetical protein [Hyphomicrobium sp.]
MFQPSKSFGAAAVLAGLSALASPAQARIICHNGFQKVGGNLISTPYCQDELLAEVAREYGMRASAARIRNNPNYKREVCRLVGADIRVSEHCMNESPRSRGRAF